MPTPKKKLSKRHAHRRRRRRRWHRERKKRRMSETDILLLKILRQLQHPDIHYEVFGKPPVDPYARGSTVPPLKTAQKMSEEAYRRAANQPIVNVQPLYPLPF